MNNFKIGDKVVCVDIEKSIDITLYKTYTVINKNDTTIMINNDVDYVTYYLYERFKSLKHFRLIKIKTLFNENEI